MDMLHHDEHGYWIDFDSPDAGTSHHDPTPGACANRLRALAAHGFNVPAHVLDELDDEQAEHEQHTSTGG